MQNLFKRFYTQVIERTGSSGYPVIITILFTYMSAVTMQMIRAAAWLPIVELSLLMLVQLIFYIFSGRWFKGRYWLYFLFQGLCLCGYAFISPEVYKVVLLGMIPLFRLQSIVIYSDVLRSLAVAAFFYGICCVTVFRMDGASVLLQYLPNLILMTLAVRSYAMIFINEVKLRVHTEQMMKELELAYEKVEELTIANERQRVARDLHDTLSQGLAGTIMQLEAVKANLDQDRIQRAREIVQQSMDHVRKTLADSRGVIQDLRETKTEDQELSMMIGNEIERFRSVSEAEVVGDVQIHSSLPVSLSRHAFYIVREALGNIAKHAKAEHVTVRVIEEGGSLNIIIQDDGVGFDVRMPDRLFGHYGIRGIRERLSALGGKMNMESMKKAGTRLTISIPLAMEVRI